VADVLGDISCPGGDGMAIGGSGISSLHQADGDGDGDSFVVVVSVILIAEHGGVCEAVPCG